MAVDEAILAAVEAGISPPTLRLYAWSPPCLSLGYAQPIADVDLTRLADRNWELVRRPTGGRAILHTDELTYSVIGPFEEPRLSGGVLNSYRVLSEALLQALHRLNIPAQASSEPGGVLPVSASEEDPTDEKGPVCFEVPSNYEITVDGKKIIGSAQARRKGGVLQHGSLPLHGDLTRITQALVFSDEHSRQRAANRITARAATAETVLGYPLDWETAASAVAAAFEDVLNLELAPGELSAAELEMTATIHGEKFEHPDWTERI